MAARILVRHMVSALHYWPNAPESRFYLGWPHMHDFHIEAYAPVGHDDRDIEFHDLRDLVHNRVYAMLDMQKGVWSFGSRSCEAIGRELLDVMPMLDMVRVWEDDSCAAEVVRPHITQGTEAVVTMCGSTRFQEEALRLAREFTGGGFTVLMVQFGTKPRDEAEKEALDRIHLRKIDMSDFIFVVDPEGYVGESTSREIEYARSLGKPVLRLSQGHGPHSSWKGDD